MADTDTDTTTVMARVTTNPTVSNMAAGDLATMWRRFAVAVSIVHPVETATHLRMLIEPRLLPVRCRLFRRMAAADVVVGMVVVGMVVAVVTTAASSDVKSFANRARLGNKGSRQHYSFSLECRHDPHVLAEGPQGVLR
jgi:hypothetical protein